MVRKIALALRIKTRIYLEKTRFQGVLQFNQTMTAH